MLETQLKKTIDSDSDEKWRIAKSRYDHIKYLNNLADRTVEDVRVVATKLHLSVAQVYNLLNKYKEEPKVSALLPAKRGWKKGKTRLTTEQIKIIDEVLNDEEFKPERRKPSDITTEVHKRCRSHNVNKPSEKAIKNQIALLDPKKRVSKQYGAQKAHQIYDPVKEKLEVSRPLELVEIDHTLVDLIICDNEYREPIGRPWLTLAIDVFTRMVLAFYLSLYRPSKVSVAATMSQMFLPKYEWLEEMNINKEWPARGIPEFIAMDNAKEFKCDETKHACEDYGIETIYRPVRRPKIYGAHIERLIGTIMGAVHLLPGTTFSNIQEKGDYDSLSKATLTFEEAEHWIALEILGKYHYKKHTGIGLPPIASWDTNFDKAIDYHLEKLDSQKLFIDFLPSVTRTVTREGLEFNKIHYWDDILTSWLTRSNRKTKTKYNPRNLSRIFIPNDNLNYYPIGYRDLSHPPVTLSEVKYANEHASALGSKYVDEDMIFATIDEQRELVETAKQKKRSARRKQKERSLGFNESNKLTPTNNDSPIDSSQLTFDESDDDLDDDFTSEAWPH